MRVATVIKPDDDTVRRLHDLGLELSYSVKPEDVEDLIEAFPKTVNGRIVLYGPEDPTENAMAIIDAGALEIRDIDGGEEPFLYSSGNWGPGYLMVKGLVSKPRLMRHLCTEVSLKLPEDEIDFVAGNVTGGLIPSWEIRNNLGIMKKKIIPFVYVGGSRLANEGNVTGDRNNPFIYNGDRALVVEELVNFAQTTTNTALLLRKRGYEAERAATILHYMNPRAIKQLDDNGLELTYLVALRPHILDAAERNGRFKPRAVADYRRFLENPLKWQVDRGYTPVKEGGTK